MAIVNVDLSEYDTLRNRVKELEEQNKELKEQIAGLKNSSRVIIRNIRRERAYEPNRWGGESPTKEFKCIVESENIVGFEDVRLKVEERMKKEIESSIKYYNEEAEKYRKRSIEIEDRLKKEYEGRKAKLEAEYKEENNSLQRQLSGRRLSLLKIKGLADSALSDLHNRIFEPKSAILIVEQIRDLSNVR